jgi:hypothetical protein
MTLKSPCWTIGIFSLKANPFVNGNYIMRDP